MFSALSHKELSIVIDAMEQVTFKQDDFVIKQGDKGEHIYVVDSGVLSCSKVLASVRIII